MIDYLIVGAGLYGSVLAERLSKTNKVLVIDKRDHIGGNCYTRKIIGIDCHIYGPHMFHTSDKEVWDYVNRFAPFNSYIHHRYTKVGDALYTFPINLHTLSQFYGCAVTPLLATILIKSDIRHPKNLKEKAISLVGEKLYRAFIEGYTKKHWDKDPTELPPEIIDRIPVYYNFNTNYFHNCRYQGIPVGGYTLMIKNMLKKVPVELGCDFFKEKIKYKHLIYSGSIDEFFQFEYGALEYRSIKNKIKILNTPDYQGTSIITYPDIDVPYTRTVEPKHFCPVDTDRTVVFYEYPAGTERFYPVLTKKNVEMYKKYRRLAGRMKNISIGGRLGDYAYYDMDTTIRKALSWK